MIYWSLLAFTVIFYGVCRMAVRAYHPYGFNGMEEHNKAYKLYFIVVSIIMILIIGLKARTVGCDIKSYYYTYQQMAHRDFNYLLEPDVGDKGYVFIQILFNKLGLEFQVLNVVYAIFNISTVSYLIYKKSALPMLSYILYITYEFFVLDLSMIRQTTAMSIVILAILNDKSNGIKSFIKFELIILVAYFIHASAIICIPIWFLNRLKYSKKTVVLLLGLVIISYLLKPIWTNVVLYIAENINERYASYGLGLGNAGMKLYLMILASVMLGLYLRGFLHDRWNQKMFYYMCMMLIIFPAVQGGGALMRGYFYFYIFMIVYVPNMISGVNKNSDKFTYYLAIFLFVAVGCTLYYNAMSTNYFEIMPYRFFWQ